MLRFVLIAMAAAAAIAADEGALSKEMLAAHNAERAKVKSPPLVWSAALESVAREWAEQLASSKQFYHRPKNKYGENLYEVRGAKATPAQVVERWAAEAQQYDYKSNKCRGPCGHYTQLVWRNTREVGCAMARSGDREVWACEYNPPGNYVGQRPY